MRNAEHHEQCAVVDYCTALSGRTPELALLYAIPNGGQRHIATARKLKAEGVRPGVPDLHLPIPRGEYAGLWIEMKAGKNKPTSNQVWWHERLQAHGHKVVVAYGAGQAIEAIEQYLVCK